MSIPVNQPPGGAGNPTDPQPEQIRVLCVDDSPDVLRAIRMAITRQKDMVCVGSLQSADRLDEEVLSLRPDVILLDLTMPGRDPIEATALLARTHASARVLAFSGYNDATRYDAVVKAGGWGLVSKDKGSVTILAAIRQVATGEIVRPG